MFLNKRKVILVISILSLIFFLIFNQVRSQELNNVECISEGKDQYKRILAECFINDESLSSYLVRSGYAFAYRKYSKKFIPDEDYAKANKIGMWSMKFDYPWDYRKNN